MLAECLGSDFGELVGCLAGGVKLEQQRLGLLAERGLDQREPAQLLVTQKCLEFGDTVVDVAPAAGVVQRGP